MRLLAAVFLVWLILAVFALRAGATPAPPSPDGGPAAPPQTPPTEVVLPVPVDSVSRLKVAALSRRVRFEHHRYLAARHTIRQLQARWRPTVDYAMRLAAAVSGVPSSELYTVARCESGLSPVATNGRYLGLFQLGWRPFGFNPFDPIANALSAALTVRHDGGWRQWECKP